MKKTLFILTAVLLLLVLAVSSAAAGNPPSVEGKPLLYDGAGLLDSSGFSAVESKLTSVSDQLDADIIILTVNSAADLGYAGEDATVTCIDDYFDRNGYGRGADKDGVALIVAMAEQEFAVSTSGYGITALTEEKTDWLYGRLVDSLSAGDFEKAFTDYAECVEYLFSQAMSGTQAVSQSGTGIIPPVVGSKQYLYIEDGVDILTDAQKAELTARLEQISNTYNVDVAVAVFSSMYPYRFTDEVDFADRYYEDNGFGRGSDRSGIVFVRVMDERYYIISTAGSCEVTMNDDEGMDYYTRDTTGILSALRSDNYYAAFSRFADASEYLLRYEQENGYAYGDEPVEKFSLLRTIGSALTGLLGGLIPVSGMKSQLKTVRSQTGARSYAKENSLNVTQASDYFIGRHVSRTRIETERSGGGGGGHYSSGGMHHGGTSGRA
jgi:uncharacterized protein